MTTTHIPATLDFKPVKRDLNRFTAVISDNEIFVIRFDADQNPGYQWRLSIVRTDMAVGVFLHGHTDKDEAIEAARRHLGMD
jgi:hypothetical protein